MKFKIFISFILLTLNSCKKDDIVVHPINIFVRDFKISSYSKNELKWDLNCKFAEINEVKNTVNCISSRIIVYKNKEKISEMKSERAFANLNKKLFFLEKNAYIKSYIQNISLKTEKVFFDYKTEKIYSNTKSVIYKDKIEIISEGFEAKSDLSNIKITKHTTKYNN